MANMILGRWKNSDTARTAQAFLANVGLTESRVLVVNGWHVVQTPTTLPISADLAARLRLLFERSLVLQAEGVI